jgi:hypothetical protein
MAKNLVILTALALLPSLPGPARADGPIDAVPAKTFPRAQQPQLAVSPAGKVYLVFGSANAVYCAASADGKAFAEPVKVGSAGALALGMRRGPRVAATDKAVVVTAIGGKAGRGRDEDLLAWRSADGGKTWKGPVTVNSVSASAREGLHHMTVAPDGTVFCTWLDLRAKKTEVYGATSADGGATWKNERLVYKSPDGSVCECCQPQVAYDAKGTLHVMWRNQLKGARDMYAASSKDHGKTFTKAAKLGRGTWPLKACPMDGGGLATAEGRELVTVWRRDKEVFRASPGQAEESLGKGEQPWAAAGPGGAFLVWVAARPGAVMLLRPDKAKAEKLAERGWDPVVAAPVSGKGPVVAAWEEGRPGAKRVRATVLSAGK